MSRRYWKNIYRRLPDTFFNFYDKLQQEKIWNWKGYEGWVQQNYLKDYQGWRCPQETNFTKTFITKSAYPMCTYFFEHIDISVLLSCLVDIPVMKFHSVRAQILNPVFERFSLPDSEDKIYILSSWQVKEAGILHSLDLYVNRKGLLTIAVRFHFCF